MADTTFTNGTVVLPEWANDVNKKAYNFRSVSVLDYMTTAQKADVDAGTLTIDCTAAFQAAINSFPITFDGNGYSYAGEVVVPPGKYYLASTLTLQRQVILRGAGSPAGNAFGSTQLHFADNINGIVCFYQYQATPSNGSDGALISNMSIINRRNAAGTLGYGVLINSRAKLDNVLVRNFRQDGFRIVADTSVAPNYYNANNWKMKDCIAVSNTGNGLYVQGGDANAGICIGLDCRNNGGWGIYDESFLGNLYLGCHTANNTSGGYKTTNLNARNVFTGCYTEGGEVQSLVSPTLVLGGILADPIALGNGRSLGTAHVLGEGYSTKLVFSAQNAQSTIELGDGYNTADGLVGIKDARESGGIYPWRLKQKPGRHYWDWANDDKSLFELTNSQATVANGFPREVATRMGGNAGVAMRQGFFQGSNMKYVGTGSAAPVAGTYVVGDIIYNEAPASAGYIGWVCTVAGTPGTWKTFGLIS